MTIRDRMTKKNTTRKVQPSKPKRKARNVPLSTVRRRSTGKALRTAQEVGAVIATMFGRPRLAVELVPKSLWYENLNKQLSKSDWDKLRRPVFKAAGHRCEICGGCGTEWPVECHERWDYDDERHVQRLVGFMALCASCHLVKHIGRARAHGQGTFAEAHLSSVNGWTSDSTSRYVKLCLHLWSVRNRHKWQQNIEHLESLGITLQRNQIEPRNHGVA
jgi:hypothetical protein